MWIVRLALRRPYTFVVFAFLILILGVYSIEEMPVDIFPNIDIPVITLVWGYGGLSAQEVSTRLVFNSERTLTIAVSDIEHIESQSLSGMAIIKIFFRPGVNLGLAASQIASASEATLRSMPPGTFPPFIIQYNAASVPVLQLGLSGQGLNEQQLYDLGTNTIRLATGDGRGRADALPLRRKTAPDSWPTSTSMPCRPWAFRRRCGHCARQPERHRAIRHDQDR